MLQYNNRKLINNLDFRADKSRVKIDINLLKINASLVSKYMYIMSLSLLSNLKSRRLVKAHHRIINKHVLFKFLKVVIYQDKTLTAANFNKMWDEFVKSPFVEFSKINYCGLHTKKYCLFELTGSKHSHSVMLAGKQQLNKLIFKNFTNVAIELLYAEPQAISEETGETPFISQEKIADYLGISQGRVSQAVNGRNKVYIFEEINESTYKDLSFANTVIPEESKFLIKIKNPAHKYCVVQGSKLEKGGIEHALKWVVHKYGPKTPSAVFKPSTLKYYKLNRVVRATGRLRKRPQEHSSFKYFVLMGTKLFTKFRYFSTLLSKDGCKVVSINKLASSKESHKVLRKLGFDTVVYTKSFGSTSVKLDQGVYNYIQPNCMNPQALRLNVVAKSLEIAIDRIKATLLCGSPKVDRAKLERYVENFVASAHRTLVRADVEILLTRRASAIIQLIQSAQLHRELREHLIKRVISVLEFNY